MKKKLLILVVAIVMVFSLVGCTSNNEPLNDGTNTETRDDTRDEMGNAADDVKDGLEDTGDAIKDGVEGAGDAIRDGVDDITGKDGYDEEMDKDKNNE